MNKTNRNNKKHHIEEKERTIGIRDKSDAGNYDFAAVNRKAKRVDLPKHSAPKAASIPFCAK